MTKKVTLSRIFILGLFVSCNFALSACAPRLVGTWSVQKYETTIPGESSISLNNIGTINFKSNGKGKKDISYTILGVTKRDKTPLKWTADENQINIESANSAFSKSWIRVVNKRKFQQLKSTDGSSGVQILELKK